MSLKNIWFIAIKDVSKFTTHDVYIKVVMDSIEPEYLILASKTILTPEEYLWCQELATTLDPFSPASVTPRQKKILEHFNWFHLVGTNGYELTQLILQKLHAKAQDGQLTQ